MDTRRSAKHRSAGGGTMLVILLTMWCATSDLTAGASSSRAKGVSERAIPDTAVAYDLKEISVFDVPEAVRFCFLPGQFDECRTESNEQVRIYPKFQSKRPLYGSFVVALRAPHRHPGPVYSFALDESGGTGRGYDRLYLDLNRNGDLSDDGYRAPARNAPVMDGFESPSRTGSVWFDPLALALELNQTPECRLEVMPHLVIYGEGAASRAYLFFMGLKAHEGTIRIGAREYRAVLGHNTSISGWFDQPDTALHLLSVADLTHRQITWADGTQLSAMHRQGDTYYRFAATPAGNKLFVWPYTGPFGTLELGPGGRPLSQMCILAGSLLSSDAVVSLTEGLGTQPLSPARSFRVPVGDYAPYTLSILYGSLQCLVARNSHADGRPGGRQQDRSGVHAFQIREDKPFVLDFSGGPQVLFAWPARDHRVKRGDQLNVKAVLIDPVLDIMFRRIASGQPLHPKVVIQRANGEIVAEGTMPFG